ncbi:phosphatase PAP2 family protein [Salicibibacter cibi]|uniref:phosphatase PAP2 family protein n=1 Tax=Salicibibacter cibi TaxID=2743001 RepID=UPI001FEC685A|nr:phosphatase PAP2 family protein [Salicibibacter cibi]
MRIKIYIVFLLFFVFILTGIWIVKIVNGTVPYVDQWTRDLVAHLDNTFVYTFFRGVTELGSGTFLVPLNIVMAIILWVLFRDWLPALILSGGSLSSHWINLLIKELVERERPSILVAANAEGYSFPSGHAMISMVCYGLSAYFIVKKINSSKAIFFTQLFFSMLILLIGMSRYFINVHYLTDVTAGFFFGFIYLVALIYLYRDIQKRRSPT